VNRRFTIGEKLLLKLGGIETDCAAGAMQAGFSSYLAN
jgi:hypothetical protein